MNKNTQQENVSKKTSLTAEEHYQLSKQSAADFKDRDIVTPYDVMRRFGVSYDTAAQLIRDWKLVLRGKGRDALNMAAKITKEDYAFVLGIDVNKLY